MKERLYEVTLDLKSITTKNSRVLVPALDVKIRASSCLVFYGKEGIIASYAPGAWKYFEEVQSKDDGI